MLKNNQFRLLVKKALSLSGAGVTSREVKKFDNLASYWWDENGVFEALHSFNRVRVPWIVENLSQRTLSSYPLKGMGNNI